MTNESRFIGNARQDIVQNSAVNVLCLAKHELLETLKELFGARLTANLLSQPTNPLIDFFYNL